MNKACTVVEMSFQLDCLKTSTHENKIPDFKGCELPLSISLSLTHCLSVYVRV